MRTSRWMVSAVLTTVVAAALVPLRAQNGPAPSAESAALLADINDIDKLRVLNPLNLDAEQIGKIAAAVQRCQDDYNRAVSEAAVKPLADMAADIRSTRRRLLAGGEIPADFDNRVKALQKQFTQKRDDEDFRALKGLSDAVRAILTPEQVKSAAAMARKASARDGKPTTEGSDDKYFNAYVLLVFINYPRIVPLLQDMRAARGGPGDSAEKTK